MEMMIRANSDNYINYNLNAKPQLVVGREQTKIINATTLTRKMSENNLKKNL